MSAYRKTSGKSLTWLWLIPALLLATYFAARGLDKTGLWHDEVFSYMMSGGDHAGPLTLIEVWNNVAQNDPTQGMGYPLVLTSWGAFTGWTPYAARALSLLFGVLSLAMLYRLGADVVSRRAGLFAVVLLSVSAFYAYYMHEIRAYAPVILFGAMLLWSYWKLVYRPVRARYILPLQWMPDVGFVVGGVGLLYTNYYTVVLLVALALYHVIFAPKNRAWLRPVGLALIVGVIFIPSLQAFLRGYGRYSTWSGVFSVALSPLELVQHLVYYLTNGQVILLVVLLGLALWSAVRKSPGVKINSQEENRFSQGAARCTPTNNLPLMVESQSGLRYLLILSGLVAAVGVIMNAVLLVIDNTRVRYLLTLWIPLMVCLGAGIEMLTRRGKVGKWLAAGMLALWIIGGILANLDPAFLIHITGGTRTRWQTMTDVLHRDGLPEDAFVFYAGDYNWDTWFTFDFATKTLPFPSIMAFTLLTEENRENSLNVVEHARRIWYGVDPTRPTTSEVYLTMQRILDADFTLCRDNIVVRQDMRLMLYVRSAAFCPDTPPTVRFGDGIDLNVEPVQTESTLTLNIGAALAPDVPPETYSLAVHVIDSAGTLVAQSDSGIPVRQFAIIQPEISLEGLPAGTYSVNFVVYNWQTGERLAGTNLQTQTSGDSVTVGEIVIR